MGFFSKAQQQNCFMLECFSPPFAFMLSCFYECYSYCYRLLLSPSKGIIQIQQVPARSLEHVKQLIPRHGRQVTLLCGYNKKIYGHFSISKQVPESIEPARWYCANETDIQWPSMNFKECFIVLSTISPCGRVMINNSASMRQSLFQKRKEKKEILCTNKKIFDVLEILD